MIGVLSQLTGLLITGCLLLILLQFLPAGSRWKQRLRVVGGVGFSLLGCTALVILLLKFFQPGYSVTRILLAHWMTIGTESLDATFTLDVPAAILAVLFTLITVSLWFHRSPSGSHDSLPIAHYPHLLFLLLGGMLVIMADHLIGILFAWQLLSLAEYFWVGRRIDQEIDTYSARKYFVLQRLSDLLLLVAMLLFWREFDSLRFPIFLSDEILLKLTAAEAPTVRLACFCFLGAVLIRCAQFPLFGWVADLSQQPTATLIGIQGISCPAALFLLCRFWPLLKEVPDVSHFMVLGGCLTTLFTGLTAATQPTLKGSISNLAPACYGLLFLALGTGMPAGLNTAFTGLVIVSLIQISLLFLVSNVEQSTEQTTGSTDFNQLAQRSPPLNETHSLSQNLFFLNGILLFSGFWTVSVLATLNAFIAEQGTRNLLLEIATGLGVFLTLIAFARAAGFSFSKYLAPLTQVPSTYVSNSPAQLLGSWLPSLVLTSTTLLMFGFLLDPRFVWQEWAVFVDSPAEWSAQGTSTLWLIWPVITHFVLGVVYRFARPIRFGVAFAPMPVRGLKLLARHYWGIDSLLTLLILMPIRAVAQFCRFLNWVFIDRLLLKLLALIPQRLAFQTLPLRSGQVQVYLLSIGVSVAVLALLMIWLGGAAL